MVIKNNEKNEIIINKSRFITYLYKINSKEEFVNILDNLKKEYKDATHICYAYIINSDIRFSDDKEPNGSAGLPIYNVLKNNNLNYIACFVIRYFGGIKLGGSGLVRAYSNSVSLCLKETEIIEYKEKVKVQITIPYSKNNLIENIINKEDILEKKYDDLVYYKVLIDKEDLKKLDEKKIEYIIKND